jgi:hypothetical protein
MIQINRFFLVTLSRLRKIYLDSNIYNKKISKFSDNDLTYKPSPHLLSSLIKYQNKKYKIEDFTLNDVWNYKALNLEEYRALNNFNWFFSLDLKSSKYTAQLVIKKWIENNYKYNDKSWNFDLTAKRIIAWLLP